MFDGTVIDAAGKWVLPGLIDMHVHLRDPDSSGRRTSGRERPPPPGGFASVVCMANTSPVNDHPEVTRYIREKAASRGRRTYSPWPLSRAGWKARR